MNTELEKNNFLVVRSFIDKQKAASLADEFEDFVVSRGSINDGQVERAYFARDYKPFLKVQLEKLSELNSLTGLTLFPTYSHARVYQHNAVLPKHTDRSACQISVTANLQKDTDWKIYIENSSNQPIGVELEQGDALVYLGEKAAHWRDQYHGQKHTQLFMHYVDADGPYADQFYDRFSSAELISMGVTS